MIHSESEYSDTYEFYRGLGQLIAGARGRVSGESIASESNISRRTLVKIEKGDPSVAFGSYIAVSKVLGLHWMFELVTESKDQEPSVPRYYLTGASALSLAPEGRMPALWYSSALSSPRSWQVAGAGINGTEKLLGAQELWDATATISHLGVQVGKLWAASHERAIFDLMYHFHEVKAKPLPNIQVSDIDDVVDLLKVRDWVRTFKPFLSDDGSNRMLNWLDSGD